MRRVADRRSTALSAAVLGWVAWGLSSAPAVACSVCYGNAAKAAPLVSSARLGVFLLLGITVLVLGSLTRFFFYLRHRANAAERDGIAAEWAQLQRSSLP